MEDHPFLAACDWLFNIFAVTLYLEAISSTISLVNSLTYVLKY